MLQKAMGHSSINVSLTYLRGLCLVTIKKLITSIVFILIFEFKIFALTLCV